jgi:hypothetical protein
MIQMDTIDPEPPPQRPGASFTIPEWCKHRRVSVAMYYKLRAQGKAPATLDIGRHKTITVEADTAWVRARQAESSKNSTTPEAVSDYPRPRPSSPSRSVGSLR